MLEMVERTQQNSEIRDGKRAAEIKKSIRRELKTVMEYYISHQLGSEIWRSAAVNLVKSSAGTSRSD